MNKTDVVSMSGEEYDKLQKEAARYRYMRKIPLSEWETFAWEIINMDLNLDEEIDRRIRGDSK